MTSAALPPASRWRRATRATCSRSRLCMRVTHEPSASSSGTPSRSSEMTRDSSSCDGSGALSATTESGPDLVASKARVVTVVEVDERRHPAAEAGAAEREQLRDRIGEEQQDENDEQDDRQRRLDDLVECRLVERGRHPGEGRARVAE